MKGSSGGERGPEGVVIGKGPQGVRGAQGVEKGPQEVKRAPGVKGVPGG